MRFYLSLFAVSYEDKPERLLESLQQNFLKDISSSNYEYYDGSIHTDYPTIFREIEKSDILVAFIDNCWLSSTWKARELWYAAGASPENNGEFIPLSLICYIYCNTQTNTDIKNIIKLKNVRVFNGTFSHLLSQVQEA